jgi:hypothetical protein
MRRLLSLPALRGFESRGWVKLERERVTVCDPRALAELGVNP